MADRPTPAQGETFAPPEDVLGQVVALQQAARARRLAPVHLLLAYAQWSPHPPEDARAAVKALCDEVYRRLYPPRAHGGAPPDMDEAAFRENYWEAYEKVRLTNLQRGSRKVQKQHVAAQLLIKPKTLTRYRKRYGLPWPPRPP